MAKLVGVDLPNVASTQTQSGVPQVQGADTSAASMSISQQALQNTGQFMQQSVQKQSQLTQQMTQSTIATHEAQQQASKYVQSTSSDNSGFFKGLDKLGKSAVQVLDFIDKRDKQHQKAEYDTQRTSALQELSQLQVDAQNIMRNESGGRVTVERRFDRLMGQYALSSDDKAKMYDTFYGTLMSLESESAKRLREETDKIDDAKVNQLQKQLGVSLAVPLSALERADTVASREKYTKMVEGKLREVVDSDTLDTKTKLGVLTYGLSLLEGRTFKSADAQMEVYTLVDNHKKFAAEAQVLTNDLQSGKLSRSAYDSSMFLLADRYKVNSKFSSTFDPYEQQRRLNEIEQGRQDSIKLKEQGELQLFDGVEFTQLQVGSYVYDLVNNPQELGRFRETEGKTAKGKGILSVVEKYEKLQKVRQELKLEAAQVATTMSQLDQNSVQGIISLYKTLKPQNRTNLLQQMPWLNQGLGGNLDAIAKTDEAEMGKWREQLKQADAQLQAQRERTKETLRNQLSVRNEELTALSRELQQYGFDGNGGFSQAALKAARKSREEALVRQRARMEAAELNGNGGVTPSFRMPLLKTVNVGGRNAVLPVPVSTDVQMTGNYMEDRGTHKHQGLDLAVKVGTPIVSPMDGKVTRVSDDPNGYGYFFEVQMADGTYHLFGHNSKINVRQNQRVSAGQILGMSGGAAGHPGSGRSSGPHIHWEVRDRSEQVMDPSAWATSAQIAQTPRQPRTGDRTGQRPSNIPKDAIPVKGGYLVHQDGKFHFMDNLTQQQKPTNYRPSSPLRANNNSTSLRDYPKRSDPRDNYGYAALARDKQLASALAKTADRLGIPGQWLADVIAHETGNSWNPRQREYSGQHNAVGFIQFYEDEGNPGGKTIGGQRYSMDQIASMSGTQQLRLVEDYLKDVGAVGRMKSIGDLASAVYTGSVGRQDNYGGSHTLGMYKQQLGKFTGRSYYGRTGNKRADRAMSKVDVAYTPGCAMCQTMAAQGAFTPHERLA